MQVYEDECCDCATPGYPCIGDSCPNRRVLHTYCDICGEDIEGDVYEDDGEDLCEDCLKEKFKKEN